MRSGVPSSGSGICAWTNGARASEGAACRAPGRGARGPGSRAGWVVAVLLGLAAISGPGCGRKGDPLPPIIEVPETTHDLVAVQVGGDALLIWSYPQLTRAGQPLHDLERIEIWKLEVPPGQEGVSKGAGGEDMRQQLMVGRGHLLARLEGPSLEAATHGSSLNYTDPLPTAEPGKAAPSLWYAVRSRRHDGTPSAMSNIVTLQPKVAPPQLTGVATKVDPSGITLTWPAVPEATYLVERRDPSGGDAWAILAKDLAKPEYVDTGVAQGKTWRYRVRAVIGGVYGPPSSDIDVSYVDVYPPQPVTGLVCLPEAGAVKLRWDPAGEPAVKYKVSRRAPGGEWQPLGSPLSGTETVDSSPLSGEAEYMVKVVDEAGNESTEVTCSVRGTT
jgi:hypothetical protein